MGRFINADAFTSTGQGFSGNNMLVYCGNNPVVRLDTSGRGWVAIVVGIVAGGGIGVLTSWIGSAVTGQEFTWTDAGVAAFTGGISSLGTPGLFLGGITNGAYSAYNAHENGADSWGVLISGISSGFSSMLSFGSLANVGDDLTGIAISSFTDLVFGTGFGSIDAAVSKAVTKNSLKNTTTTSKKSALDVARASSAISHTRVFNGRTITIGSSKCSFPGDTYYPNRIYCYVEF